MDPIIEASGSSVERKREWWWCYHWWVPMCIWEAASPLVVACHVRNELSYISIQWGLPAWIKAPHRKVNSAFALFAIYLFIYFEIWLIGRSSESSLLEVQIIPTCPAYLFILVYKKKMHYWKIVSLFNNCIFLLIVDFLFNFYF